MDHTHRIHLELDRARVSGPVQKIVIPPCPELLTRLQAAMAAPEPDWQAVVDIANSDVAMSVTLMRQASSPVYARLTPVESIRQAVNVLGIRQSAAVLSGFLARRALKTDSPLLEHFWESSAQRALVMAYIAKQLYTLPPDLAQTLGLFCDVGMPVMMQSLPGYSGTLAEALARRDRSPVETENHGHQTDHAVVGALVSRAWQLSPTITSAIRLHHDFDVMADTQIPETVRHLVAAALIAEHIVNHAMDRPDTIDWTRHGERAMLALHVHADEVAHWSDVLLPSIHAANTMA